MYVVGFRSPLQNHMILNDSFFYTEGIGVFSL
jgi:hypothetical protein